LSQYKSVSDVLSSSVRGIRHANQNEHENDIGHEKEHQHELDIEHEDKNEHGC